MSPRLRPSLSLAPPAIPPRLLHEPALEPQCFMDPYRGPAPESSHSLYYPSSPASDTAQAQPAEPVTSPSGMLVIRSYGPASGPEGAPIIACVDFNNITPTSVRLRIVFGDLALPTTVTESEPVNGGKHGDWKLGITVPPMGQASTHTAEVGPDGGLEWPLTLQALDSNGSLLDTVGFGLFVYDSLPVPSGSPPCTYKYQPGERSPHKRSREDDEDGSDYSPHTPTKRLAMDTHEMHLRRMSSASVDNSFINSQSDPTANRAFINGPSSGPSQPLHPGLPLPLDAFQHHPQLHGPAHPRHMPPEAFTVQPAPDDYSEEGPALVRTSQLGVDAKPEQASVEIEGNLENMKNGWTDEEFVSGRRLVQFWKRQVGTTIHISFGPVSQQRYSEHTIVISCIYRDNIDECFITSVDVIYLLEALAGNRFEVEEKNRIRRNLEGFRPMTVSKSKPCTEEFFRVIMEFPPPRPRNIEKDIKVFEWGKLKTMIEKVFSKYSTVPLPSHESSPRYDGPVPGPSQVLYTLSEGASLRAPPLPVAPSSAPRARRRSPPAKSQLNDTPVPAPLPMTSQPAYEYPEYLPPTKYEDNVQYDATLESGGYAFAEMRYLEMPLELDTTLLKVEAFASGNAGAAGVGSPLDGFRSASSSSSDNSPLSMTLSLSSGPSSDGGHVEAQDLSGIITCEPEMGTHHLR